MVKLPSHASLQELYSHAYDSVGVMFASCPNFNDFYTEQAINNNGLECIRFLNEILSDYDDLLESPKFHNITKIKTIGPTYMAASGMQGTHSASGSSEVSQRRVISTGDAQNYSARNSAPLVTSLQEVCIKVNNIFLYLF